MSLASSLTLCYVFSSEARIQELAGQHWQGRLQSPGAGEFPMTHRLFRFIPPEGRSRKYCFSINQCIYYIFPFQSFFTTDILSEFYSAGLSNIHIYYLRDVLVLEVPNTSVFSFYLVVNCTHLVSQVWIRPLLEGQRTRSVLALLDRYWTALL